MSHLKTEIQTLLFPKTKYTRESALKWAKSHGYKYYISRETANYIRLRQTPPSAFDQQSFVTKPLMDGVQAVFGHKAHKKYSGWDEYSEDMDKMHKD